MKSSAARGFWFAVTVVLEVVFLIFAEVAFVTPFAAVDSKSAGLGLFVDGFLKLLDCREGSKVMGGFGYLFKNGILIVRIAGCGVVALAG